MMSKKKPFSWRKAILIIFACFVAISISVVSFVLIVTSDARLDLSKLTGKRQVLAKVYDENNNIISDETALISEYVNDNTKNAFIAIEDKRFNQHNGIDIKRIGGAIIANIKSRKKSQGASTITQQLVKNTHLSSEKSINRKLKEIKLALQLERALTKDEIFKAYVDKIYFGNGCIGIEEASNYYFGKKTTKLTTAESALLAGLAKAPSNLEPKNHLEKALERKNLVLGLMHDQKLISDEEYNSSISQKLNFVCSKSKKNKYENYVEAAKTEACNILNISREELESSEFSIETFADEKAFDSIINNITAKNNESVGAILVDGKTGAVKAFYSEGNFNFLNEKRQPGSAIKPILVFGPSLQENIITPESFLLDEKTNFDGYEPQNAGNVYSGWISARKALSNSKNIPAVKLLQICGIEKAKSYAKNAGIKFNENDNSLALALGGMTEGVTITELATAYTTFPSGESKKCCFVKRILGKSGNIIYEHKPEKSRVFSDDVSYLVYDMMKDAAKDGTARKLSNLPFEVASKTGTVGNENGNTDCYNVSVTSEDVCIVHITSGSTKTIRSNGSTTPTIAVKNILQEYYKNSPPPQAKVPDSVKVVALDSRALSQNKICIATEENMAFSTKRLFSKNNMPTEVFDYKIENEIVVTKDDNNKKYYSAVGKTNKPNQFKKKNDDLSSIIDQILGL